MRRRSVKLTVLRARFKKVPKEVEKAIRAMTDSIVPYFNPHSSTPVND